MRCAKLWCGEVRFGGVDFLGVCFGCIDFSGKMLETGGELGGKETGPWIVRPRWGLEKLSGAWVDLRSRMYT